MISSSKPAAAFLLMSAAVLACSVAPAARGADRGAPRQRTILSGTIRSIDLDDRAFTLDSNRGRVTVQARDASIISDASRGRNNYSLRDLRRGERVEVEGFRVSDDRFRADIVRRLEIGDDQGGYDGDRDPLHGRPYPPGDREGRTRDGLIGVVTGATNGLNRDIRVSVRGRQVRVDVPRGTGIRRRGDDISVHELRRDDLVRVVGDWQDDGRIRARRIEVLPEAGYGDGPYSGRAGIPFTGTIDRIDRDRRTFRLRTGDGDYEVDARDSDLVGYERDRRFGDLENGELARVYGERQGRRLIADRISPGGFLGLDPDRDRGRPGRLVTVGGTVQDIDFARRTFRLRTGLAPVLVRVRPDAVVRDERGRALAFRDLEEGDRIRVIGTQRDTSGYFYAERLEMGSD